MLLIHVIRQNLKAVTSAYTIRDKGIDRYTRNRGASAQRQVRISA